MISFLSSGDEFIGFDRDEANFILAKEKIWKIDTPAHLELIRESFEHIGEYIKNKEIGFILYDLGVSSLHYDDGTRGFSLRTDGPLDMRFDRSRGKTAEDLVHSLSEKELADIFYKYADEPKSRYIARAILEQRESIRFDTTFKLKSLIESASFDKKSPIRVFQALRIAVNDEFGHIERSLETAIKNLAVWWKIAVITFHSLEDRLVKNIFAEYMKDVRDDITGQTVIPARLVKYSKKPIEPTEEEVRENPRSRSAKLRVVERVV